MLKDHDTGLWTLLVTAGCLAACGQHGQPSDGGHVTRSSDVLAIGKQSLVIGLPYFAVGGAGQELASAVDARQSTAGTLFVLDARLSTIQVFDSAGRWIANIGRSGSGPGEFGVPRSIALDGENRLHVFDASLRRISRFRYVRDTWLLDKIVPVPVDAGQMCLMDERYFLVGLSEGHLIHEMSLQGTLIRSFGRPFGPPPLILQEDQSQATISCFASEGLLLVASRTLPEVRAYSVRDGSLRWSLEVPDYHSVDVKITDHGVRFATWPGITDLTVALTDATSGIALLQVGKLAPDARSAEDVDSIITWLIDADKSTLLGRVRGVPLVLSRTGTTLLTRVLDSVPIVEARPFRMELRDER